MKQSTLPRYLFAWCAAVAVLTPFIARLPIVPLRGWEWLTDYLPGLGGLLFFAGFNLIPAIALFVAGRTSVRAPVVFWFALAAMIGYLLWAHGGLSLSASSTAAIALMFIPIYAVGAVAVGAALGWVANFAIRSHRVRAWSAGAAVAVALVAGVAVNYQETSSVVTREARFPIVSTRELALQSRNVYACCSIGRIEVMALDNFDTEPGNDLALLGASGFAKLHPHSYAVKAQGAFREQGCDGCVHMYPHLVPNLDGSFLVATSDGLSESNGRLLWRDNESGFSEVVPIRLASGKFAFLAYDSFERVVLRDVDGAVLWKVELPVEKIGVHGPPNNEQSPFAIASEGERWEVRLFSTAGALQKTIALPDWATNVQSIEWPDHGHLLVGSGNLVGVLDESGKAVLQHAIEGTSFDPYHGPDGTAVRFRADEAPYLAVLSHGSSGYHRSVLLVFDPAGRLVWQEELNKLRTLLAVARADGESEVLLVGGMDGLLEYSLPPASAGGETGAGLPAAQDASRP